MIKQFANPHKQIQQEKEKPGREKQLFRQLFLHEVCTPYAYLLLGFLSTKKNAKTNICPTHVNEIIELYVLWLNYKLDGREAVAQSVIKETAQQKSSKTIILINLYLHRSSKVKTNNKIPTKGIHLQSPGCFRLKINNTEIPRMQTTLNQD